jgi:DHA2 family methylenomycin A resistance protein-like MFS transporter
MGRAFQRPEVTGVSAGARSPWVALTASITAFTLVIIGTTVVNVALPSIRRDLGSSVAGLQWVINAYTLMLASLLLSMGALCDQRGARRVMLGGVWLFVAGAVLASVAPSLGLLLAGQVLLGTGAAALMPASLTLISHAYPDERRRARAIAMFASASAVSIGLGPVLGGLLIEAIGWRAIFVMDIPLALLVALLVLRGVAETPHRSVRGLDLRGQLSAILALGSLTFALIEGGSSGWRSPITLGALGLALLAGALFVGIERRGSSPMLPLSLFGSRLFSASAVAGLLVNFGIYGLFFVLSLYLQDVRGLSPLQTGVIFLVQPGTAALAAMPAGAVTARRGPRLPVALGGLLATLGALVLLSADRHSPYATIVLGLMLLGAGGGTSIPALTTAVVAGSPRSRVGVAGATFTVSRQTGGILGVALLGAMVDHGAFIHGLRLAIALAAGALAASGIAGGLVLAAPPRRPGAAAPGAAVA